MSRAECIDNDGLWKEEVESLYVSVNARSALYSYLVDAMSEVVN